MIPEMRVGDEAMRRLWLVVVGVDGLLVPVPALDSDVLTAGVREEIPRPVKTHRGGDRDEGQPEPGSDPATQLCVSERSPVFLSLPFPLQSFTQGSINESHVRFFRYLRTVV